MRRALAVVALASFGCGQTTSGDDGGGSDAKTNDVQGFDQFTTGCSMGSTKVYEYDASVCAPQLERGTSCNGSICSWSVIIPCTTPSDAGADADADVDAGVDCNAICNGVQPPDPHSPPSGFCQPSTNGTSTTIICGGCGV